VLKGTAGTNGTNGTNGKTWLNGTVAPASTLGVVGDFYLDTVASVFYGPKTSTGWGAGVNLRGATGQPWLSGTVPPTTVVGNVGDFCSIKLLSVYYGPKTATGWPTGTNDRGAAGQTWLSGTGGPASTVGNVGDFYLDTAASVYYGAEVCDRLGHRRGAEGGNRRYRAQTDQRGRVEQGHRLLQVGNVGDLYLDTVASACCGPETAAGWGLGVVLKGANGSTWPSGAVVPATALGNVGDLYLNTATDTDHGRSVWSPVAGLAHFSDLMADKKRDETLFSDHPHRR